MATQTLHNSKVTTTANVMGSKREQRWLNLIFKVTSQDGERRGNPESGT